MKIIDTINMFKHTVINHIFYNDNSTIHFIDPTKIWAAIGVSSLYQL